MSSPSLLYAQTLGHVITFFAVCPNPWPCHHHLCCMPKPLALSSPSLLYAQTLGHVITFFAVSPNPWPCCPCHEKQLQYFVNANCQLGSLSAYAHSPIDDCDCSCLGKPLQWTLIVMSPSSLLVSACSHNPVLFPEGQQQVWHCG